MAAVFALLGSYGRRDLSRWLLLSLLLSAQVLAVDTSSDPISDGFKTLADIPWTDPADIARSPFGVSAEGVSGKLDNAVPGADYPTARNQIAQNYWGAAFITKTGDGRIVNCIGRHSYVGVRLGSSDSSITDTYCIDNRDAGLWINANAGNCKSSNTHAYGARIACYCSGSAFRATQDTYADSFVGFLGDWQGSGANQTILTNVLFQHNTAADCVFKASGCHMVNCIVNVMRDEQKYNTFNLPGFWSSSRKFGVYLGSRCSIEGGTVELLKFSTHALSGNGAEAVWVAGDDCVIQTHFVDDDGIEGSTVARIKGGRRNLKIEATLTGFSQHGDRILVFDENASVNGLDETIRVDGSRPVTEYVDASADWHGTATVIDTKHNVTMTITK